MEKNKNLQNIFFRAQNGDARSWWLSKRIDRVKPAYRNTAQLY